MRAGWKRFSEWEKRNRDWRLEREKMDEKRRSSNVRKIEVAGRAGEMRLKRVAALRIKFLLQVSARQSNSAQLHCPGVVIALQ
jgi:hypothetical protein